MKERYHKLQLAETWPAPGGPPEVFKIDGVPCWIIICHDERYPELVRLPVLAGARVVFYLSHESGLKEERKLTAPTASIQARAVENNVYVVQARARRRMTTRPFHGQSRIIAPDGNILHEASFFGEEILAANLELEQATGHLRRRSLENRVLGDWWGIRSQARPHHRVEGEGGEGRGKRELWAAARTIASQCLDR